MTFAPKQKYLRLGALIGGTWLLGTSAFLSAQEALYVKNAGAMTLVVAAEDSTPLILEHGQLVAADDRLYVLQKVPEFNPALITISHLNVAQASDESGNGNHINNRFMFQGKFTSDYPLEHVVLVLEMNLRGEGRTLFIREVGSIGPDHPQMVELVLRLLGDLGGQNYKIHLFSDGREVLNSKMPLAYRERVVNEMVLRRTLGMADRPPRLFEGPRPEYPPDLRKAKVSGHAVVRIRIDPWGKVQEPVVVSASAPEFGGAALDAIRQWRFLPRISNGVPTSARADFPFDFAL